MTQNNLKSPLLVFSPKFSIDNKRNIFAAFSVAWQDGEKNAGMAVLDYWCIADKKERVVRYEPNEIIPGKGKAVSLIAENALSVLSYDELTVTFHFLITTGFNSNYSMTVRYFSNTQFRLFKRLVDETDYDTLQEMERNAHKTEEQKPKGASENDGNNAGTEPKNNEGSIEDCTPELEEYIRSLNCEKEYLKHEGGKEYKVTNGHFIKRTLSEFIYCFDLEAELFLADDSPLTLRMGLRQIAGTVSFCENFLIIVSLAEPIETDLKAIIQSAFISSEPWKLLENLVGRLNLIDTSNRIAMKLMKEGPSLASNESDRLIKRGQDAAIKNALSEPITIVWGPPGTGKTYTMAKLAGEYVRQGKSVLIVSHSNISVDNVVKQIYTQFSEPDLKDKVNRNRVLRYGYVRDEELQKNPYVVSFNAAIQGSSYKAKYDELTERQARLVREQEFSRNTGIAIEIKTIEDQLKRIRSMFKDEEKKLIDSAAVVATTASKIYADSLFEEKTYDAVMFDEVSMAYVPQIICAASFAEERLVCVGDFRQLAPIVQSEAKTLLGKDLFEYLGICSGFTDIHPHPWLFMLDEQRRMHPDISRFPSRYVYHGLLTDHSSVQNKWSKNVLGEPFPGQSMTLIDLHSTCCAASKNEDNSRFNILSAVVSFGTALKAESAQVHYEEYTPEEKVGIITPYAAQTRLIRAMIQDYRKSHETAVSCATVHQFQGSERNTVIFDAVESFPSTKAGWLMSKNDGGSVTRLINVALTRARGKFVTVTNNKFWLNKFDSDHMYYALVRHMNECGNVVGFQDNKLKNHYKTLDCGGTIRLFSEEIQCVNLILDEIKKARKEVTLMLPQGVYNQKYGKTVLDAMHCTSMGGVNVSICRDKEVCIPTEYEKLCLISEKVTMPLLFIDNVIWYGVPVMTYSFTDKNLTYNAVTPTIIRFSGANTVEMIRSLVDRSGPKKTYTGGFALYVRNNLKCVCGAPYKLSRGQRGFYLRCPECGKTEMISTDLINSYLDTVSNGKCPECGCDSYARVGMYGCYVTCANRHIRNLNQI